MCDGCGRLVCGHCLHLATPDHHDRNCDQCLRAMSPYGPFTDMDDDALIAALGDAALPGRHLAARLLGHRGCARAVDVLLRAMGDEDRMLRAEAALALGRLGDQGAVPPLIAALSDADFSMRRGSAFALTELGWQPQGYGCGPGVNSRTRKSGAGSSFIMAMTIRRSFKRDGFLICGKDGAAYRNL